MSEKRKTRQKLPNEEEVTKEEYAVAKYLRFGLPTREGKMHRMDVECFIAGEAVDKLLESKWSANQNSSSPLFTTRASCVNYMNVLLQKSMFHRADREVKKKEKDTTKKKKKEKDGDKEKSAAGEEEVKQRKVKKEKKSKKEEGEGAEKGKTDAEPKEEKKKEEKKKKEKRFKLVMSEDQWFEDGDEVYVWIYDPIKIKTFVIGLAMVLGAILLCMFPLWPEDVRIWTWYLSVAAAAFVGFILFLAVVRLILFCIVWLLTLGRHHFWFLPNLTEDVGFFDSFRPLYHHESVTGEPKEEETDGKKKKRRKKNEEEEDKDSSTSKTKSSNDKDDSDEFEVIKKEDLDERKNDTQREEEDGSNLNEEEERGEDDNGGEEDLQDGDSVNEDDDDEEEDSQNNSGSEQESKKTK